MFSVALRRPVAVMLAAVFCGGAAANVRAAQNVRVKVTAYVQAHTGEESLAELRLRHRQELGEPQALLNAAVTPAAPKPLSPACAPETKIPGLSRDRSIPRPRGPPAG